MELPVFFFPHELISFASFCALLLPGLDVGGAALPLAVGRAVGPSRGLAGEMEREGPDGARSHEPLSAKRAGGC